MTLKKALMNLTPKKVILNRLKKNRLHLRSQDVEDLPERLENQCAEASDAKETRRVIVRGTNLPTK